MATALPDRLRIRALRLFGKAGMVAGLVSVAPTSAAADGTFDKDGTLGETTVFAEVPDPGHPFGVLAGAKRVFVATASGNPLHINGRGERLFTYSRNGRLASARRIDTAAANMGLYGLARDAENRLYVGDMNGRVLRYRLRAGIPKRPTVYGRTPPPYSLGGWYASMWNGIAFDRNGNLYVADNNAAIWRIPPNGSPEVWFRDVRLAGGPPGGPFGATLGPDGRLYFVVVGSALPGNLNDAIVYRLPLLERPSAADLEEFHVFPASGGEVVPGATALAFGRSGRAYVAVGGTNQIAILSSGGKELRRISLPMVAQPTALSFLGRSLLVTSSDFSPVENPARWKIVRVRVGEAGMPVVRPRLVPGR